MSRRKKGDQSGLIIFLAFPFVVVSMCWDKFNELKIEDQLSITTLAICFVAIICFLLILNGIKNRSAQGKLFSKVNSIADNHLSALVVRRAQLVQKDAYGNYLYDKWLDEIEYFLANCVIVELNDREQKFFRKHKLFITNEIIKIVRENSNTDPALIAFNDKMTPNDFEIFCANQLIASGWDARVTQRSRDQGVDIIAEKFNKKVVLQCKLYSKPVGNKAVQEISAGKAHERAQYAAVVSNNKYTYQAQQLALTNRIFLLHYRELQTLDKLISNDLTS